jgi:RimJ/RimL family protein N-acetyltransferase
MSGAAGHIGWPGTFEIGGVRATPLVDGDAALFATLYGDPATMDWVGRALDRPTALRAFAAARRQMRGDPPAACYWRLATPVGGDGLLSLVPDATTHAAETGVLLPPAAQARGVATAVLGHLRDAVFGAGGCTLLWTRHRVGHAAAEHLMRRLGFVADVPADGWQRWYLEARAWRAFAGRPPAD